jgi:two-component system, response regulator
MNMAGNELEVLLIEDNAHDAELAVRALRRRHLANHVVHLRDGEEALDFLFARGRFAGRDASQRPKVVLLDLKLPKVDGLEVLRAMKSDPRTRSLPVVVLTSSREHSDVEESYRLGANSYIVKPVEFENFSEAVAKLGFYWLLLNEPPGNGGGGSAKAGREGIS